jgi:hypothetical protein
MVVGKDDMVAAKTVELGPVAHGLRIVRSGLTAQDRVVVSGIQMAMPGAKVQPKPGKIAPVQSALDNPVVAQQPVSGEATFAGK